MGEGQPSRGRRERERLRVLRLTTIFHRHRGKSIHLRKDRGVGGARTLGLDLLPSALKGVLTPVIGLCY